MRKDLIVFKEHVINLNGIHINLGSYGTEKVNQSFPTIDS